MRGHVPPEQTGGSEKGDEHYNRHQKARRQFSALIVLPGKNQQNDGHPEQEPKAAHKAYQSDKWGDRGDGFLSSVWESGWRMGAKIRIAVISNDLPFAVRLSPVYNGILPLVSYYCLARRIIRCRCIGAVGEG